MSLKTLNLNKDLCRCCHAEGAFDDLAQPYSCDGREELVYSDMIKDSFNIEVSPVPGHLCVVTYKICKNCIQRVRDAFLFKKQVQACEKLFMDLYKRTISENKGLRLTTTVKEELSDSDAIDDFSPTNDYDEDYDMKSEDSEDNATLKDIKKSKAKSKATTTTKQKKRKEIKSKKIKEEVEKGSEEEIAESKKKKGKPQEGEPNYTLTTEADGTEWYTCNTCQRAYKNKMCFKQHYNHVHLHLRPKLRGCYLCKDKVPGHLRAFHLEQMHGIPAPTCNACGKKFAFPFEVLRHQKIFHMGEKKFVCDICNMSFARRNNLRQHVVKHSSVRSFKCDYCSEAFKWRKHLARHMLLHMKRQKDS